MLPKIIQPLREQLDSFQFAYQPKRSVQDAVSTLIQFVAKHTDTARCYARTMFVDFSSAFNTIQPYILIEKLRHLDVKPSLILWISSFLNCRSQKVRINDSMSDDIVTYTGSPQGCVLSPSLFILYTNDCVTHADSVHIIKYADDTAIVGLIGPNEDETEYRSSVDSFVSYCDDNFLNLNVGKTKEMIFDFRKKKNVDPCERPIHIDDADVEVVDTYKYLGTTIDSNLSWGEHTQKLATKCNQRLYFLRKLRSFHVDRTIMNLFYSTVIESVMTFDCIVWYNSAKQSDVKKLKRVTKQAEKILRKLINLDKTCEEKVVTKALSLTTDANHPLNTYYTKLRSGRRWNSVQARTNRYVNSFIPYSIRSLNANLMNV